MTGTWIMHARYQVGELLGHGGRGEVRRGWDLVEKREVAIKRLRRRRDGEDLEELAREALALKAVMHPNVVTVYDAGVDEEGAYMVMERVDGETLGAIVSRGALTGEDFLEMAPQVLEGMSAAHRTGLAHLDLNPENLMVSRMDDGGIRVKILDFGLAKPVEGWRPEPAHAREAVRGTVFFMAPEQFEGGVVDGRADVYALGCVFYHALTGRHPFEGELAAQVVTAHLLHKREPLERLRPDLGAFIPAWVDWMMSREPGKRPQSMDEALKVFRERRISGALVMGEP